MVTLPSGYQDVIMQVLLLKVLSKNRYGRRNKRQGTTTAEKNSLKRYGTGKTNMVEKSTISSKDMVFPLIGIDLLSHWMKKDQLLSPRHS